MKECSMCFCPVLDRDCEGRRCLFWYDDWDGVYCLLRSAALDLATLVKLADKRKESP